MTMRVKIEYGPYNSRRYGRPWGAAVSFEGTHPKYCFASGSFLGDDKGGSVCIESNIGGIVAVGQKDNRGGRTENTLYIVQSDGSLVEVDKVVALEHWESHRKANTDNPLAEYSDEELIAELRRRGVAIDGGS